jgi:hypothetical protein
MTAARPLAAILVADAVGYSMLIVGNELGTAVWSFSKGAPRTGDAHNYPPASSRRRAVEDPFQWTWTAASSV